MNDQANTRILLIVGFLTVLFLFKDYAESSTIEDLLIFGVVIRFQELWFINTLTFAITLFFLCNCFHQDIMAVDDDCRCSVLHAFGAADSGIFYSTYNSCVS